MIDIDIPQLLHILTPYFIPHIKQEMWGTSIYIMQKEGTALGRVYWFNNDNTSVYLDCLSVNIEERRKGIGTLLQVFREEIGRIIGANFSILTVLKDSWMYNWHIRRGYASFKENEEDSNFVWMRKTL